MPAAAEAPAAETPTITAEPPMTPVGDVYEAALAKERGDEPKAPEAKPEAKKESVKTEPKAEEKKADEPAKPTSALDAALEQAPADEKKAEPAESVLKDLPETLPREGRGEHWAKARAAIERHELTIGEQAKRIAELSKTSAAPPEEVTLLRNELAEKDKTLNRYKDAIVGLDVKYDPEFQAKYVQGRDALVGKAVSKLNAFGGNGEALKEALDMAEGRTRTQAIKEALGEIEDVDRDRVMSFINDVYKLDDERAELEGDPQQAWEKLQQKQAEALRQQNEQIEQRKRTIFDAVSKALPGKLTLIRPVDPSVEGGKEWNESIAEIKENAFKLLGNDATPEQLAEAALWATAGPKIQERWLADRQELSKLRTALKEYEESEPGFRGGKPAKKDAKQEKIETDPGKLYDEAMAAGVAD